MVATITREELLRRLAGERPPVLIEALPPRYFLDRHLPGAINIPNDQVASLAPGLLPKKNAEIVDYCANAACKNSHIAARHLEAMGYGRVRVYVEGKQDWIEAGLPVEPGATTARAAE